MNQFLLYPLLIFLYFLSSFINVAGRYDSKRSSFLFWKLDVPFIEFYFVSMDYVWMNKSLSSVDIGNSNLNEFTFWRWPCFAILATLTFSSSKLLLIVDSVSEQSYALFWGASAIDFENMRMSSQNDIPSSSITLCIRSISQNMLLKSVCIWSCKWLLISSNSLIFCLLAKRYPLYFF